MLSISPKGTVPVMVNKSGVIEESLEIIDWIMASKTIFKNNLNADQINQTDAVVKLFDESFKYNLDRYKYAQRFDANPLHYRKICVDHLKEIEMCIKGDWFFGNDIQKIDICILPFIRQFRIADIEWFDNFKEIPNIQNYLNGFLSSSILKNVMQKYDPWEEGDDLLIFPKGQ
jgi:glutathione S-transferase